LKKDRGGALIGSRFDLLHHLLDRERIRLFIARTAVKSTEKAVRNADVRVIGVGIDHIGHPVARIHAVADRLGEPAQVHQVSVREEIQAFFGP